MDTKQAEENIDENLRVSGEDWNGQAAIRQCRTIFNGGNQQRLLVKRVERRQSSFFVHLKEEENWHVFALAFYIRMGSLGSMKHFRRKDC